MPDEPFDTVDDLREWLEEQEPTVEEAEEALEVERDNDNRTTAKMAIKEYLDDKEASDYDAEEDDEEEAVPDDEQRYVVMRPFAGHNRGDELTLDPSDDQTQMYVRDGRIQRRPN